MARFGVPPEEHWPNSPENVDAWPDALAFASASDAARRLDGLRYVRLDARNQRGKSIINTVRSFSPQAGPAYLGSRSVPRSPKRPNCLPDGVRFHPWSQAVLAVGFDDTRWVRSEKGALLVRAGWGPGWGENGFGWLPYAYVSEQLAVDFWTLFDPGWLASGEFERPT